MKVVINACFGGFGLSPEATLELWRRGGPVTATPIAEWYGKSIGSAETDLAAWRTYLANPALRASLGHTTVFSPDESLALYAGRCDDDSSRSHPELVKLVEEMGDAANGPCAKLKIVEVPDDANWEISEYDGNGHVAEKHRSWS